MMILLLVVVLGAGIFMYTTRKPSSSTPQSETESTPQSETESTESTLPPKTAETCAECPSGQVHCPWPLDDCKYCCTKRQYEAMLSKTKNLTLDAFASGGPCKDKSKLTCLKNPLPTTRQEYKERMDTGSCCTQEEFDKQTQILVEEFKKIGQDYTNDAVINRMIYDKTQWTNREINQIQAFINNYVVKSKSDFKYSDTYPQKISLSGSNECSVHSINLENAETCKEVVINNRYEEDVFLTRLLEQTSELLNKMKAAGREEISRLQSDLNRSITQIDKFDRIKLEKEVALSIIDGYTGSGTAEDPFMLKNEKKTCHRNMECTKGTVEESLDDLKRKLTQREAILIQNGSDIDKDIGIIKYKNDISKLESSKTHLDYPRFKNKIERNKYYCRENNCVLPNDYFYGIYINSLDINQVYPYIDNILKSYKK